MHENKRGEHTERGLRGLMTTITRSRLLEQKRFHIKGGEKFQGGRRTS